MRLDRHAPHAAREGAHDARDRGLHLEQILTGLEQEQIDAALHERRRLLGVQFGQFVERNLGEGGIRRGDQHARGPERTGHEARALGRREFVGGFARDLGGAAVEFHGPLAQAVLVELEPRGGERVGLDDVGAGLEVALVDAPDQLGPEEDDRLVAAPVAAAAEGRIIEFEGHQFGAHGAVEDHYALGECGQISRVHCSHYALEWTKVSRA